MHLELFWYVEVDLPDGVGFFIFDSTHVLILLVAFTIIILSALIYCKNRGIRRYFLLIVAFALPILEAGKILFLVISNHMNLGYLPLHLCSLSIWLYPLFVVLKPGIIKECIGDFCCIVLLPAALMAILFPDWTMYPIISFMSLYSFLWHTIQILLPICLLCSGEVRPILMHIWRSDLLFFLFSVPVGIFDYLTSYNYWFLLRPISGTPLETIYQTAGAAGYLPLLALTAAIVVLFTQLVISIIFRRS